MNTPLEYSSWDVRPTSAAGFIRVCKEASDDPSAFAQFRKQPWMINATAGIPEVMENRIWHQLNSVCNEWFESNRKAIKQCDAVGGPRQNEQHGMLSPEMIRYAYRAFCLTSVFGSMNGLNVVEIGGGFGALAAVLCMTENIASYTIVDLPAVLRLQRKYLEEVGVSTECLFVATEQVADYIWKPDLVISDCALSELTDETRDLYAEHIIASSPCGSMKFNSSRRTMPPVPLIEWLATVIPHAIHRGNYFDVLVAPEDRNLSAKKRQEKYPDITVGVFWGAP